MRPYPLLVLFGLGAALLSPSSGVAAEWGTIKGQIVWGGKELPKREPLKVDKDPEHCLSKGPILSQEFVINAENKGVRWVVIWLAVDDGSGKVDSEATPPIHPDLKEPKDKEVVIDQPCCKFEPHVLAIREGQIVIGKNSSPIAHSMQVLGGKVGPNLNPTIPPGGKVEIKGWKKNQYPVSLKCGMHPWMGGYVRVYDHPYFAVSDADGKFEIKNAPAGKYRLVVWHEGVGWGAGGKNGTALTIKAEGTTDLGKVALEP